MPDIPGLPRKGGNVMPASKAQQKAVSKYMKENYDVYQIRMKKGQKEAVKAHASDRGESVNGFITRAIQETIARDSAEGPVEAPTAPGGISLPSDTIKAAQEAAEAAGEAIPAFIARAVETQAQWDKMGRRMKGGRPHE